MVKAMQGLDWFIGWDVGGWNCDKNIRSRDAIVILDDKLNIAGKPWRGNLRNSINEANTSHEWVVALFELCQAELPDEAFRIYMGIDTPLGFSDAFVRLLTEFTALELIGQSNTNPYLYRQTERYLFEHGLLPLSAIKDMIGSQATKGMHVLARFASQVVDCGVWSDGEVLTAIEAYPSAAKRSATIEALLVDLPVLDNDDCHDALICALVAYLFVNERQALQEPEAGISEREGWIWVPKDALNRAHKFMIYPD